MLEPREGECRDLSPGGMFIMTPRPSPRGALIRFECSAQSAEDVFRGTGRVVWQRNKSDPRGSAGMGIRFVRLEAGSREALQRIIERVHQERQRARSDPERRTSSGPPPRVRTAEAVTQPVPILNAPGAENPFRPEPSPTPSPAGLSELRKATLRGVPVGSEGLPDLGPGLRSPLPPAPPAEPTSFTSTLPLHSSAPAPVPTQLALHPGAETPATSPDRSVTVPLPHRNSTPPAGAEAGRIPSPLPPSGGTGALRERLDRTRRGVGSSSSGPPEAATPVDRAAPDLKPPPAETGGTSAATPTMLNAVPRERSAAPKGPTRDSLNPATLRGGSNMERTLLGRPSDRPPRPGGIDDLRTQRSPLPPKLGQPSQAEELSPVLDEPEIAVFPGGRKILPADRGAPTPLLLPDLDRTRKNAVPLWVILGSGLVASALIVKLFGGAPVGVLAGSTTPPAHPPNVATSAAQTESQSSHPEQPLAAPTTQLASPLPTRPSSPQAPTAAVPTPSAQPAQHPEATARVAGPAPARDQGAVPPSPAAASGAAANLHAKAAADAPHHRDHASKPPAPPATSAPGATPQLIEAAQQDPAQVQAPPSPAAEEPKPDVKHTAAAQEAASQPTPMERALDCLARGDNRCVIRALEDKASNARELELLIATYRTVGSTAPAEREMKRYLEAFPNGSRAGEYQRWLEHRSPGAEPGPAPSSP